MTKEEINLLTLKPYHQIRSTATGRLYIDKDLRCYLFEAEREALQFCKQYDNLEIEPPSLIRQASFIAMCHGFGIEQIRVKTPGQEQFVNIKIQKEDIPRRFYNPNAQRNILRLKQTKKKKYLMELTDALFLYAVAIPQRKEKEYPTLQYCYATLEDNTAYFLLFTSLYEFEEWNKTQDNKFAPCKTTLNEFRQIRKGNPVLINPTSDRLVLTDEQLKCITSSKGE